MVAPPERGPPMPGRSDAPLSTPPIPSPTWTGEVLPDPPVGLLALWLAAWGERGGGSTLLVHVARGGRRARALAAALGSMAPEVEALPFPAWDSLPYDRLPPSRAVVGRRQATLHRLGTPAVGPRAVLTTAEALIQRLPAPGSLPAPLRLAAGQPAPEPDGLRVWLDAAGYVVDERVDEPGEAALRGAVVDLFPAAADRPCRLELADGRIAAIRRYDPITQRSLVDVDAVELHPAVERPGTEATLLDHAGSGARIVLDRGLDARLEGFLDLVRDAHGARRGLRRAEAAAGEGAPPVPPPRALYLDEAAWRGLADGRPAVRLEGEPAAEPPPAFAAQRRGAAAALAAFVRERLAANDRVVLAAEGARRERRLADPLARALDRAPRRLEGWRDLAALPGGTLASLRAEIPAGFALPGLAVVAAVDVLGRRRADDADARGARDADADALLGTQGLGPGDLVVHARHGIGRLLGLEAVGADGAQGGEHLVLEYAGGKRLLVPALELDQVWRYGSAEAGAALDRVDGDAWEERRARIAAEIDAAARELARRAAARAATSAPALRPPRGPFERVARRFPFEPTEDQAAAIAATLADLARASPPMDRLVCGDVGFGKTEVALRAVAAAALAGHQAALLAPTTLLARQHLATFRRRLAGLGVRVELLARTARAAESRAARAGLADGSVQVAVGTHALASPQVRFKDLALLVVDEEQRFGTQQKRALRRLREGGGVHLLSMSATPIPRTLQAALAGVRELSVIATPPVRRRPVRTFVLPFDPALVREALERERRRGGRSFVVVPRVADLEPMAERLRRTAPGLDVAAAHGRMKAEELDAAVLAFADGAHDVLLTTSIVETGLDIPGADTMIVWDPARFGLAQLHQLRGRVGRGRERGVCYLLHDPDAGGLTSAAERRLRALAAFEDLGAGFLISAQDLELRGAGDLAGDAQSGHLRLIGTGLHQDLLARALRRARGEPVEADWSPELRLDAGVAALPVDYVPEPELRLEIYRRLARLADEDGVGAVEEEIADRFGPPPEPVAGLLRLAALRARCRALGVIRLDVGDKGAAATFLDAETVSALPLADGLERRGDRVLLARASAEAGQRLAAAAALLDAIGAAADRKAA